ncbi:MAG: HsdR family type I site-specific deoxyribonuclease [Nitrospinae bacterium]|nr:HsdR family type I site-specific deoxyribonuclease [Nitrospinota bacterium]
MTDFTEKKLVEDYILQRLQEKGWKFVPADNLERNSYKEPLLIPNLVRALKIINVRAGFKPAPTIVSDEEINKTLNELMLTVSGIEGSKRILFFYKFGIPVKFEKERVVNYIRLFDFADISNNEFIVTRQVNYDGRERIRTDLMFYVNGIPLVNIECKNPVSLSENWYNAYKQIKDYEKTVPELYKYIQIGIAAEVQARYFPIVSWQKEVKVSEWKWNKHDSVDFMDSIDSTIEMLSPITLLDIINNFLFFRIERGEATKVITRYMQYRAANKIVNRVVEFLKSIGLIDSLDPSTPRLKNKGLVWHWQGSGKTLTMIFAANKLYYSTLLENPTVFFIVDRVELEEQLYKEFFSLDIVKPEIIGSVWELKEILKFDDYRGKRGVFIVLIHKFRYEELNKLQKEIERISEIKETIMNRKNVIAFVDEGHRTQYGLLASQMKAFLKSAFFFALTGTPISKRDRNTYLEFSYLPDEPYLDKYFITDSIKDNFTVKIVYQPRLEKEVHLKKEMLDAFFETELEELPEDVRDGVEERIKKRLNAIKLFLENPHRIRLIAEDIASHFKDNIDGKFKAMVVAASRKACELYRKELNKHLPEEYVEVIMTYGREDESLLLEAVAETKAHYGNKDIDSIRKETIEKYKEEEFPKILIVTDMLLTGFDAPTLQVMYLDKPLKEHRLLQAVARTNRPFNDIKEAGLIIDYIGILKEFKRALEMYSEEDIKSALFSYDNLIEEFVLLIHEILEILKEMPRDYERETLLKAVEILTTDKRKEKEFVGNYKKLRKTFELIGPDEIKLEYFEDYKWLSAIYTYYMKVVVQKPIYEGYIQKYYNKTERFIHNATEIDKLERDLPSIDFDTKYLEKLKERIKSKKEKAANILFTLNRLVLVERHRTPVYESLVEKVERLLELWKEKIKDYEKIYLEGSKIFQDINTLSDRQKSLGFTDPEYAILLELERALDKSDGLVEEVKKLSKELQKYMFFGWFNQTTVKKEVEREIRRFVRGIKGRYNLSLDTMNGLHDKLMEGVKNYGTA